jgi:alkanesulfonate monooxygenase SsuD/methylene tetrahydromethanopterin reductase-like flavin-dependent oxidoreductase (luciferase family)
VFQDVGIDLPQDVGGAELAEFARQAQAAGFDSLWTADSAAPGIGSPLETLAFAAAAAETPRLGVAVLLSALRAPLHLARELATVDRLSGGRVVLGVGLGGNKRSYPPLGLTAAKRAQRFERGIVLLRRLLAEPAVSADEPWWTLHDQPRPLEPVQQPGPPLWFGGQSAPALERAVRLGDGYIGGGSTSSADFLDILATVRRELAAQRRDPAGFPLGKRVYVHVGPHNPGTIAALDRWFEARYRDGGMADRVMVTGTAAEVVAGLAQLREAGTRTLVLSPILDRVEQLHLLAAEVAPQLPPPS